MNEPERTHYADDETLAYIRKLEQERDYLREYCREPLQRNAGLEETNRIIAEQLVERNRQLVALEQERNEQARQCEMVHGDFQAELAKRSQPPLAREIGLEAEVERLQAAIREALNLINKHGHTPELPDPECPSCGAGPVLRGALAKPEGE